MHKLSSSIVNQWSNQQVGGKWCPVSVDVTCPHCTRMVTYTLAKHKFDPDRNTISASARCPACTGVLSLWIVNPGDGSDPAGRSCDEIAAHPNPPSTRVPLIAQGHLPEPALERAYYAAVKAYNVGLWDACATSCRKTLEGIVHTLDKDGKGPLFNRLNEVFSKVDLTQPLVQVTDSLRKGGNMGAHFDLEKEPTQEVAAAMLDLLDFFIEYIFVLKERAASLEKLLDSVKK